MKKEKSKVPYSDQVASKIIDAIKNGTAPFVMPWKPGEYSNVFNPVTDKPYKGINSVNLACSGYKDPRWCTYNQAANNGWQVKSKEKGERIQYWKFEEKIKAKNEDGTFKKEGNKQVYETIKLKNPKMFTTVVFNLSQMDNTPELVPKKPEWDINIKAEQILNSSGATIENDQGNTAFYRPSTDSIHLPKKEQFDSQEKYYGVALHELGHWTGHSSRLDRDLSNPFGSEGYAKEELRAEISSFMVGAELGLGHDPSRHAAYIKSWVSALESDPLEIFRAAKDANEIKDYVIGLSNTHEIGVNKDIVKPDDINAINITYEDVGMKLADLGVNQDRIATLLNGPDIDSINSIRSDIGDLEMTTSNKDRSEIEGRILTKLEKETGVDTIDNNNIIKEKKYLALPYEDKEIAKKRAGLLDDGKCAIAWDKENKSWFAREGCAIDKIDKWLPGNVASVKVEKSPLEEFGDFLRSQELVIDGLPIMDGKIKRVPTLSDKKGKKSGSYTGYLDGIPAGFAQNFVNDTKENWSMKGLKLTDEERAVALTLAVNRRDQRENDRKISQDHAAKRCQLLWSKLLPPINNKYGEKKGIDVNGARQDKKGRLVVPFYNDKGDLRTVQRISENGFKSFKKGSQKSGCSHLIEGTQKGINSNIVILAEGYSTGKTLSEATGCRVYVCADSGNMPAIAKQLKESTKGSIFIVAGDDDQKNDKNVGRVKAMEAAEILNGTAVFPIFNNKNSDGSDFNDLNKEDGIENVSRQIRSAVIFQKQLMTGIDFSLSDNQKVSDEKLIRSQPKPKPEPLEHKIQVRSPKL